MFALPFTRAGRTRKLEKATLDAARVFYWSHEDVQPLPELKAAIAARDARACAQLLERLDPPRRFQFGREWLDILVVSISVAMAFRAYFYEPFNIPTGSMRPTLHGNWTAPAKPSDARAWDVSPGLKQIKWLLTGETFVDFKASASGTLMVRPTQTGHNAVWVSSAPKKVEMIPTDAFERGTGKLIGGKGPGESVRAGERIWCGRKIVGDFLFVNRWLWNFRRPRVGDVMIFATTGIEGLQQGTHYIKRMCGTPGDKVEIKDGKLWVNGALQDAVRPADCPPFSAGPMPGEVKLDGSHYFACGDNSPESYDSRYWGAVPASNLRGIAGGVFWPLVNKRWGVVK